MPADEGNLWNVKARFKQPRDGLMAKIVEPEVEETGSVRQAIPGLSNSKCRDRKCQFTLSAE